MAFTKGAPAPTLPTVRFFVGGKQVFGKQTLLQFNEGAVLELFGTRYRVADVAQVLNLESETETTDVTLENDVVPPIY